MSGEEAVRYGFPSMTFCSVQHESILKNLFQTILLKLDGSLRDGHDLEFQELGDCHREREWRNATVAMNLKEINFMIGGEVFQQQSNCR